MVPPHPHRCRMMAAPQTPFDVRNAANAPLTVVERIALECLKQIANEGRRANQLEIQAAIGSDNSTGSTASGVLSRLEAKGYITRTVYQRGVKVCIPSMGICTAEPQDTSPHWRHRTEPIPAPAIQTVRERLKPLSAMIEAEARMSGKNLSDFLADLVYIGWYGYCEEKEMGAR